MAEALNSLVTAELIRNRRPWRCIDDLEIAVAEYIDGYNNRRRQGEIGLIPPAEAEVEAEATFYATQPVLTSRERDYPSLHKTRGLTPSEAIRHRIVRLECVLFDCA